MTRYLLLVLGLTVAILVIVRLTQQPLASGFDKPMPCYEDEAYIWVDAPTKAQCVPLDNLGE